jgi:hypothetical protein
MLGRWLALAACLGVAVSARAVEAGAGCELARADRLRTPSSRCIACHDGAGAHSLGPSHPVDVDYARASARAPGRYEAPARLLPQDITLVDGKVACVSCHSAASRHRKHAVDPVRLCAGCHRL